ncbi:hypothetical protein BU25DRAFT_354605 [Macroventuria anomochaeta]|uniref:Uncharacterized protein n=1 Tax=Macroventuria anomochaeta TaxID=301207 RepID=A0ACB6RK66_9PLEO|nr:uncharacterized protein BU25DRAFT_354605 [Macroventuria anomochaeta]KAF2621367.1 hypothetical protein BU25DRAFT_354605 [Macroventuria anomochaeta]
MGNLCCASRTNAAGETDISLSIALDHVLTVFLLCFEAAINTFPFYPPLLSTTRLVPSNTIPWLPSHIKVWEFTRDYEASLKISPHNLGDLPTWYRGVDRALRKTDRCDHFCLLLDSAFRAKLEEHNLGTSRWVRFPPRPLALFAEIKPNQSSPTSHLEELDEIPPAMHSVLEITTTNGAKLIFDGTPEQFGWSNSAWTLDKGDIEKYYVEGEVGMMHFADEEKRALKRLVLEQDQTPWETLFGRMEELLSEMNWEAFKELEDEELWETIKDQARRKFEGVGDS